MFAYWKLINSVIIIAAYEEDPRPPISPRKGKHNVQQKEGKSHGRCLKLNNNCITNLQNLIHFTEIKFEDWKDIAWIDLSHNELQKIGPVSIILVIKLMMYVNLSNCQ